MNLSVPTEDNNRFQQIFPVSKRQMMITAETTSRLQEQDANS